jgi:sugar (pentulose or hexulose) kinase
MRDDLWLGIDLGTQSVRAIAVDNEGVVLAQASAPLTSHRDGPRHTQSPNEWWSAVCTCCLAVTRELHGRPITALSIDATSGTILLVDSNLQPTTEAMMYDDARASAESDDVNTLGESFWADMGYRTQRSWALPKLLWLQRNQPESLRNAHLVHQNDFIHTRLAGKLLATDSSHALKTGYDLLHNAWPSELFDQLHLPASVFPEVTSPGRILGELSLEAATATGLPQDCLIVSGMTDGCASQIAAGAIAHGQWNSVIGTTLVLKGASRDRILDPLGVVYSHRSPSGLWLPGGASSVGAGMITKLFPGADLDAMNEAATALGVPTSVMYPLAGQGERFPFTAPEARAFTLSSPQTPAEEYAALLTGVACIERLCFDYLAQLGAPTNGQISITGGATRSAYWNQLRADILQRPLAIPASTEAAFGAAILAASHASSLESAVNTMVHLRETIHPRPHLANAFDTLYHQLTDALHQRGWLPQSVAAVGATA